MRLSLLAAVPLGFVVAIVAPRIARATCRDDVAALESQLRSAAFIAALPVAAALLALVAFGGPAISLLFGAGFADAQQTAMVLVLGQLANACFGVCGLVLLLRGDAPVQFMLTLVAAALNVIGGVLVVSRFGSLGVAWVACGTLVLTNVSMYGLVRARHGLNTWLTPSLNRELFR
jgi:O-antigen/teichoic acid export membrane protein